METKTENQSSKEKIALKDEIMHNLDNPKQLERLYQESKGGFKRAFNNIYPEIQDLKTAQVWNARLNFENEEISWGASKELWFVIAGALLAGLVAKIPNFTGIDGEFYYTRNLSFVVFPFLASYFAWKQKMQTKSLLVVLAVFVIPLFYINLLPKNSESDTLILACIHLPLFLWAVLGYTFVGGRLKDYQGRLDFLRYNGDLVVMTAVILLAGFLLSAITIGLFELIGIKIEEFYFKNVGIWGLAASPIIGTFLVRSNPQLVNKVSPVIAKVFTPLVFLMLVVYLIAIIYTGKDPYNDRDFLLIFNLLLLGVMALILFSIAESPKNQASKMGSILLIGLSFLAVIVNGIALSAIVFRITEWGITPNRLAVLGGNILILTHLLLVGYQLVKTFKNSKEVDPVEKSLVSFLPVYAVWAILVTFLFPFLFGFK